MSRAYEKVAGGAHLPERFRHRRRWFLSNQMIGAYLHEDRKNIHLRCGDSNRAKDIVHLVDYFTMTLEMTLNVTFEFDLGGQLCMKDWMPIVLLIHVIMCTKYVLHLV